MADIMYWARQKLRLARVNRAFDDLRRFDELRRLALQRRAAPPREPPIAAADLLPRWRPPPAWLATLIEQTPRRIGEGVRPWARRLYAAQERHSKSPGTIERTLRRHQLC